VRVGFEEHRLLAVTHSCAESSSTTRDIAGRRYRFYVSVPVANGGTMEGIQIPRISAGVIEPIVMDALARVEKKSTTYLSKPSTLAFLAPDVTEAILDGRQSDQLTLARIRTTQIPLDWHLQRDVFALT